jgi:hypothetical protein
MTNVEENVLLLLETSISMDGIAAEIRNFLIVNTGLGS